MTLNSLWHRRRRVVGTHSVFVIKTHIVTNTHTRTGYRHTWTRAHCTDIVIINITFPPAMAQNQCLSVSGLPSGHNIIAKCKPFDEHVVPVACYYVCVRRMLRSCVYALSSLKVCNRDTRLHIFHC